MTIDAERHVMSKPDAMTMADAESLTTPAGLDARATLTRRRRIALMSNVATWLFVLVITANALSHGGWTMTAAAMVVCLAIAAPWPILGFWNAVIGLWQLHGSGSKSKGQATFYAAADNPAPITVNTAVLMTLRNEDPARALLRLKIVKASLDRTSDAARFSYFVLSDSDGDDIVRQEEILIEAWRDADPDRDRIIYRRRTENEGFKAGNVRDFAVRWGPDFELMLALDADSLMTGEAIVDLVRIMQAYPRLGILQSLVVGTPSSSAFARIFQFGMRLGMRTYTMGQAWWVGDCGPFWGHNALVRIKPYVEHCQLDGLLGDSQILSHDQVEAVLMRRAGYEVRVLPVETGSYEDNPPDLLEFMRRDSRWCQGNLQYFRLIGLPGLKPVSRVQLLWAILMFLGVPAGTMFAALLPVMTLHAQNVADFPWHVVEMLYAALLVMHLAPKLAGVADAVMTPGEVRRFGGGARFALSAVTEILFSLLLGAITTIRTAIFMIALMLGKSITWNGQQRDGAGLSWQAAFAALWPQLLFGLSLYFALAAISPALLLWSLPLTAGYLLAIPFAVFTASPGVGRFFRRYGIAGVPEDFAPPIEIRALEAGR
ncbi:glucans biosynthesis glucosyltransferase MdoH [Hyphomicrobium sp.]|jgi:membrane glycosyltransferase|uniref:glucans biosynthesis glucosyltransferase MdoH n=1 Tax=Hyphomicrobium sp. TaxID=82 RepID=UPI003561FA6D